MKIRNVIPVLVLSLGLMSGCGTKAPAAAKPEEKPVAVSVSNIQKTKITSTRTVVGKVKPVQEVSVYAKVPGKVSKVYADVGQRVEKGQVMFSLEDKDTRLQVSQAESALNAARANLDRTSGGAMELQLAQLRSSLNAAELNMNDAKTAYDNTRKLYDNGAVSKQSYDSAELRYKTALEQFNTAKKAFELTESKINNENVAAVESQVKQAQAAYELSKSQLDNMSVTAPADGVISARSIDEGEFASNAMAAFIIVDISSVMVEVNVLEDMANKIVPGDKYDVVIKSINEKPYTGEVISVNPNADPRTQTYLVRLSVPNTDGKLKGGMLAEVKLAASVKDNVLAVPIDAVVDEGGNKVIYLIESDQAVRKEVKTGLADEKLLEVFGDLKESDVVVIKGQHFINEKTKIIVVK